MPKHILAIDAGTTGVTALIIDEQGKTVGKGYQEFEQHFPQPGWVEHDPEQIWQATLEATKTAIDQAKQEPDCIGITNQRETVVLWNRDDLKAPTRAIVWQDRRTANLLDEAKFQKNAAAVQEITGLKLDPYFSSSKLLWIKRNLPEIWNQVEAGRVAVGTVDSYLIARLTGGRAHVTDASNASRTQLCDIRTATWHPQLLELFEVPESALPKIVPSIGEVAKTYPFAFFNLEIPITGIAGDQQAALFGQFAFEPGEAKCTYGTGAFLLQNTGEVLANAKDYGLLNTIAWQAQNGKLTYAIEGSVFVAGAAVQWLRDNLQIIEKSSDIEPLARQVADSAGVVFVPALAGLGAPHWNPIATGTITGITRGTNKAHLARATLEGIAWQVTEVFEAMAQSTKTKISKLKVDGGASANQLLLEIQATQLDAEVLRPRNLESTSLGAAYLAGLGAGIFASQEALKQLNPIQTVVSPNRKLKLDREIWNSAVSKS
ncbi:MAG: FGGY family carbohydrate kinase [Micrococcales bacterium]